MCQVELVCLVGISDLVSRYLPQNQELIPGYAIATTLDKGIYAKIKKADKLIYKFEDKIFECSINEKKLEEIAQSNSFYAYLCGTVLYVLKNYKISGVNIEIQKMDLPMKKGLASSAAICMLVVYTLNDLYALNLSKEDIVRCAYEGEHLALSQCGMLDQSTIINNGISKLTFHHNKVESEKINVLKPINFVIVDLKASKDTRKIMTSFNNCFPFAKNEEQKTVHELMGVQNKNLVSEAKQAIETGDSENLGKVFWRIQKLMDKTAVVCNELEAPVLHSVLEDEKVKSLTYGGKGTGSGGDGSALLVAKNVEAQKELVEYLNQERKMDAFDFNLE